MHHEKGLQPQHFESIDDSNIRMAKCSNFLKRSHIAAEHNDYHILMEYLGIPKSPLFI